MDDRFVSHGFPRASEYHPDWIIAGVSGGANPLWLTEWLADALDLRPACGYWTSAAGGHCRRSSFTASSACRSGPLTCGSALTENLQRIRDAGVEDGVFPIHGDARALPFAAEFFDAIVSASTPSPYYGTDDLYLSSLARFVKPGGPVGIAGAGLVRELEGIVPAHLRAWWTPDLCVPALGRLVAEALGAHRRRRDRAGRHAGRRLDTLARLASRDCARQPDRDSRPGSGSRQLSRLRPRRRPPPGGRPARRTNRVGAGAVPEDAAAPQRGLALCSETLGA